MVQPHAWAIGVDLGGTKIHLARVTVEGRIEENLLLKTDVAGGPATITAEIIAAAKQLQKGTRTPPLAIGVAVAGQIDEEHGIVRFAPNLGWRDVPLGNMLGTALDLPVLLMNDVRAATWGEWLHGAGRDCNDLVCLFAGTGIGGGVVSGGRVLTGCSNTAGEIGHMTIDLDGPPCTCRNTGCVEAIAGGWAIARSAREAIRQAPEAGVYLLKQAEGRIDGVTARIVGIGAVAGDPLAVRIMDRAAEALGAASVSLVNAFNPCRLILGGGVIEGMPRLIDRIRQRLQSYALQTAIDRLEVIPARLQNDAGAIGMAACALRSIAEGKLGRSAA